MKKITIDQLRELVCQIGYDYFTPLPLIVAEEPVAKIDEMFVKGNDPKAMGLCLTKLEEMGYGFAHVKKKLTYYFIYSFTKS